MAPLVVSCSGSVDAPAGPGGSGIDGPPGSSAGTATAASGLCEADPATPPLRRLTRSQYRNAVRDIVRAGLNESQFSQISRDLDKALERIPDDRRQKGYHFSSMDNAVSDQHTEAYFKAGTEVARLVTSDAGRVRNFMGCRDEAARKCIDGFLDRFGSLTFRHKLQPAELEFLRGVYGASDISHEAVSDVIAVALNAPQFLYQLEVGTTPEPDAPGRVRLNDYELATRLAFQFWNTAPDAKLLAAAASGELTKREGYEKALNMVLDDPRVEGGLREFVREWLDLDSLPNLRGALESPVYRAMADGEPLTETLHQEMIEDVVTSFIYSYRRGETFRDWFLSQYSFARSDELAAIYGTPKWNGTDTPPRFPPGQRAGLITRAALVATGIANTRPIKKGVLLRDRILCGEIGLPDPNAVNQADEQLSPTETTREAVERLTENRSPCSGCHTTKINGLGFATENYDPLGRLRNEQPLFQNDGTPIGSRPVDTVSKPYVVEGDDTPTKNAHELAERISQNPGTHECFAKQFIRYATGVREPAESNPCTFVNVRAALQQGGSLKQAIRALALSQQFRTKVVDSK